MSKFVVTWTVDLDEPEIATPADAAAAAIQIFLTDPHANLFVVTDEHGKQTTVEA